MAARAGHPQNAITACVVPKNPDSQSSCPDQERQSEHQNKNLSLRAVMFLAAVVRVASGGSCTRFASRLPDSDQEPKQKV